MNHIENKSINRIQRMLDSEFISLPVLYEVLSKEYPIVVIPLIIKKDSVLLRVRINNENSCFSSITQLSYPPASKSLLMRASLPNHAMFYGVLPDKDLESNNIYPRIVALYETCEELRDPNFSGCKLVTFSKWRVKEDLHIFSFPVSDNYKNYSYSSMNIRDYWKKQFVPYISHEQASFSEYIGDIMAIDGSNSIYEISANSIHYVLCDDVVKSGYQGVTYPSQVLNGMGPNVALTPKTADNCCQLESVVTSVFKKEKDNTDLIDLLSAEWDENGIMRWREL